MATGTSRINALRGFCREFGIAISAGSRVGVEQMARVLADPRSAIPPLLRETLPLLVEEIRLLEARIARFESRLTAAARKSQSCVTLRDQEPFASTQLEHKISRHAVAMPA